MTITTGEYLVSRSSLPSGTAMAHWLSVQSGDRIIYCSQTTSVLTQDELVVTRKPSRPAPESKPVAAPVVAEKSTRQKRNLFAFAPKQGEVVALFAADEITVTQHNISIPVMQQTLDKIIISRGPK